MKRQDLAYPFRIDALRRVALSDYDDHIREMMEQVIFTIPGERVNRPDFGTHVRRMVFGGRGPAELGAARFEVHAALSRQLGDRIDLQAVDVSGREDGSVEILVTYAVRETGAVRVDRFSP
jgi:phage baseplate assembly protein W